MLEALRERIAAEVVEAVADVASYRSAMAIAHEAIRSAQKSYEINEPRFLGNEGFTIELLRSKPKRALPTRPRWRTTIGRSTS